MILLLLLLLVAVVVVALQWDRISYAFMQSRTSFSSAPATTPNGNPAVPTYTQAQGAQDAPRAEVMTSRSRDYETCMETLRLRRVEQATAQDTCRKMVDGLYRR